jgi:hypothetical protein
VTAFKQPGFSTEERARQTCRMAFHIVELTLDADDNVIERRVGPLCLSNTRGSGHGNRVYCKHIR